MPAEYTSRKIDINAPAERVYQRFSNPENLRAIIDNAPADRIPADKLEQLKNVEITPDSITIPGGPTGAVTLRLDRCVEPTLVRLKAADVPMDIAMELRLEKTSDCTSRAQAVIVAEIPMMLRPMVKGPLQQVADKVAELFTAIPFND